MNAADDRAIDEIFSAALALPEAQRERFVRERCGGDAALEREVASLLQAAQASDQRLADRFYTARETMWRAVLAEDQNAGEDLSGQRVNAWRLTRRLARGGLATVYLARRDDGAFDQVVAFKVMRRGLDTDDLIARFRAERQILSTLDHPSIAQIIDGGALEDGRPYLVLEYIDGEPITDFCRNRQVGIRGRLELLMDVLQALHHAHKHLVVHRDVKPSNILVSSEGHVSVLDFGIAKLLDPESMPGASTLTRTGVSLLTPGYGSPEQCLGRPVTTASDIYQVGVVLYELLTGTRPAGNSAGASDPAVAPPSRLIQDKSLREAVHGDLDAITGKAMHADSTQRYASAPAMREDLQRYLDNRPIQARRDTLRYRVAKLARRRPWVLPVVVAAVMAVGGYLVTVTLHARQLQLEQQRAQAALTFMTDLLRSADPFAPADPERGSAITVVEALAIGAERLHSDAEYDPQLRASLLASIADVYEGLDQHRAAIELRHEALALERELYGDASTQVLDSLAMLARQYRAIDQREAAIRFNDEQLALARRLYPEAHPAIGAAEADAAALQFAMGDREASERLYTMAIEKLRQAPREYSRQLVNALVSLSARLDETSRAEAAALLEEARRLATEIYGPESLSMAMVHAQAGTTASNHGNFAASEQALQAALEIYESKLGANNGVTIGALNNLGVLYIRAGDLERAERVFRELLARSEQKYGREHRSVAGMYQNLGAIIGRQGRYEDALPLHREAADIYGVVVSEDHFFRAYPFISIAYAELQMQDYPAAEQAARRALELLAQSSAVDYPIAVAKCLAGLALQHQGFDEDGEALLIEARAQFSGLALDSNYRNLCGFHSP